MNTLTETERSYLAGFFDGEGCISIKKTSPKNKRTPSYSAEVIISQKDPKTLEYFQGKTNIGHIYINVNGGYDWRLSVSDARKLIEIILPYLRDKKDQAELILKFLDEHNRNSIRGIGKGRGYTISDDVIASKENYFLKLKELKWRGGTKKGRKEV